MVFESLIERFESARKCYQKDSQLEERADVVYEIYKLMGQTSWMVQQSDELPDCMACEKLVRAVEQCVTIAQADTEAASEVYRRANQSPPSGKYLFPGMQGRLSVIKTFLEVF